MKKRVIRSLVVLLMIGGMCKGAKPEQIDTTEYVSAYAGVFEQDFSDIEVTIEETEVEEVAEPEPEYEVPAIETSELYLLYQKMGYSDEEFYDDLELLAEITLAEAGNQSDYGQLLVIDTVLNRIDSPVWRDDDTIREVITHPHQYETYGSGAYMKQEMNPKIAKMIEHELLHRTNYEVIYFRTDYFFEWAPKATNPDGTPLQEGKHCFSKDEER